MIYQPGDNDVVDFGGDDVIIANGQSNVGNLYLYTGRNFDSETGMSYYRTRYFDPKLGRFISRDVIGCWSDMTNLGNGYTYVGNNSLNHLDALGLGKPGGDGGEISEVIVIHGVVRGCFKGYKLIDNRCYLLEFTEEEIKKKGCPKGTVLIGDECLIPFFTMARYRGVDIVVYPHIG